ncbi:hypothetical protein [Candidatus Poriferisocius sp.]|uniref:hypothetical protein n=1 Tax=Candidatus Poriferisocius sp. TaxID=3101276 RepID=UPI003B010119
MSDCVPLQAVAPRRAAKLRAKRWRIASCVPLQAVASRRGVVLFTAAVVMAIIGACGSGSPGSPGSPAAVTPPVVSEPGFAVTPYPDPGSVVHADPVYRLDGNRITEGSGLGTGFINQVTTKDLSLDDVPTWITGASTPAGDVWVVALADGTTVGYRVPVGGQPVEIDIVGDRLNPGQPPMLAIQGNSVRLATTPANALSSGVPVYLNQDRTAYVDNLQRFTVLEADGTLWRPDLEVLPDTRMVQVSPEKVLLLAGPTNRYPHSALGDNLEATSVVAVTVGVNELETIYRSGDDVIETIAPLLADVDGDGIDDVVLTVSNDAGIRIVVVSSTGGGVVATSDPTDRLLGWRQLIAVGPLGPDGGTEIAEILHPSTDGSVRFLKRNGPGLDVVAQKVGYRSHEFGTRNLEQALVVDADRDGHPEVVVPTLDRQSMAGVRHAPDGAAEMWVRPLGGTLATNIAALTRPDGTLSLAAGTREGSLRIWQ